MKHDENALFVIVHQTDALSSNIKARISLMAIVKTGLRACLGVCLVLMTLACQAHVGNRTEEKGASFAEFDRRARAGEPMSVVFFGGSLTWGANASDPQRTSYRALMAQYLRERYPQCPLTFHDASIGGTGSKLGMFRLQRDVLSREPDLVFLDFTANDDLCGEDLSSLAAYEGIVRRMIEHDVPVLQAIFAFRWNFDNDASYDKLNRRRDHLEISHAYHMPVGDLLTYLPTKLKAGDVTLDELWPIDDAHPGDDGYRVFFEAVRDAFNAAVDSKMVCTFPQTPIFSDAYQICERIVLVDRSEIPDGWRRGRTFRTSAWFDGLSSRWMGDVLITDAEHAQSVKPLIIEFEGTLVGVLGEADAQGAGFRVAVDGKPLVFGRQNSSDPSPVWQFDTKEFGGRLLVWRELANDLEPGRHTLQITPVFAKGEPGSTLRIESICVAGDEATYVVTPSGNPDPVGTGESTCPRADRVQTDIECGKGV